MNRPLVVIKPGYKRRRHVRCSGRWEARGGGKQGAMGGNRRGEARDRMGASVEERPFRPRQACPTNWASAPVVVSPTLSFLLRKIFLFDRRHHHIIRIHHLVQMKPC